MFNHSKKNLFLEADLPLCLFIYMYFYMGGKSTSLHGPD
jgi:hypothetical protein